MDTIGFIVLNLYHLRFQKLMLRGFYKMHSLFFPFMLLDP